MPIRLLGASACTALLLASPPGAVPAAVVVEHLPLNTGGPAADTHFIDMFGTQTWELPDDDFSLSSPASIQHIRWWGFYGGTSGQNSNMPPIGDELIRIRFYSARDLDGLPDSANLLLEQFVLNPARAWTGRIIGGGTGAHEYAFDIDLASPIALAANTPYWLELAQIGDVDSELRWEVSQTDHNGYAVLNPLVPDWHLVTGADLAFQLSSVPEPGALILLIFAAGWMCIMVRAPSCPRSRPNAIAHMRRTAALTLPLLLALAPSPAAAQSCLEWRHPDAFSARSGHAFAFDSRRGVAVLLGGFGSTSLAQTWEWDGGGWTPRAAPGPSLRQGCAMAFDARRGVTVLFGGNDGINRGDTWEWDGNAWTLRATTGPAPRWRHAMAFDAVRGVTVLFAGANSTGDLADTWEWDGAAWTARPGPAPPARDHHAMAFDIARGVTVLFGGANNGQRLSDTWELNGAGWLQATAPGPASRWGHAMAYDAARFATVLFGGYDGADRSDTWEWDGTAWSIRTAYGPPGRHDHALAYDSVRSTLVMTAGANTLGVLGDTWEGSAGVWSDRADLPAPRTHAAIAFDDSRGVAVMFGGSGQSPSAADVILADTWTWNGRIWTPVAEPGPSARESMAIAYDSRRHVIVLFGGYLDNGRSGETWEWGGQAWSLRAASGPSPRAGPAMAYDAARGVCVLFGGAALVNGTNTYLGDTWEWNGAAWTQVATTGPSPRNFHAMCYDDARGTTLLFGGTLATDTWEWNGASWRQRATSGPPAGWYPALVYDTRRHTPVLFASTSNLSTPVSVWEWDGAAWHSPGVVGPRQRYGPVAAFDPLRNEAILFGGWGHPDLLHTSDRRFFNDLWQLRTRRGAGDVNADGAIDGDDVPPFVALLLGNPGTTPPDPCAADLNGDGAVDPLDVPNLVAALLDG